MNKQNIPPLISIRDFAKATGIAEYTARKMCRDGVLPAKKLGSKWFVFSRALQA